MPKTRNIILSIVIAGIVAGAIIGFSTYASTIKPGNGTGMFFSGKYSAFDASSWKALDKVNLLQPSRWINTAGADIVINNVDDVETQKAAYISSQVTHLLPSAGGEGSKIWITLYTINYGLVYVSVGKNVNNASLSYGLSEIRVYQDKITVANYIGTSRSDIVVFPTLDSPKFSYGNLIEISLTSLNQTHTKTDVTYNGFTSSLVTQQSPYSKIEFDAIRFGSAFLNEPIKLQKIQTSWLSI